MAYTRTVLVTGASSGIGYRVCGHLAGQGTRVIVHAPTPPEAHAAVASLIRGGADPELLHPVAADYRRLSDVMSLAGHLGRHFDRIDLLINNAGAVCAAVRTVDGFDATWQINYLAHYVLTRALGRPLNAAAGRVVTVSSALHREGRLDPDNPVGARVRPVEAYANAQLAQVLFTRAVALSAERRVTAVAVHPGCIDTGNFSAVYGVGGLPVDDGAVHVLHAADPAVEVVNGGYYEGLLPAVPAPGARDAEAAMRLWSATGRLFGWDYTAARARPIGPCRGRRGSGPSSRYGNLRCPERVPDPR